MESNHVFFALVIIVLAVLWWFLYQRREADFARARAAVKALLEKQQADLDSYIIRTDLHLTKLEQVRQSHDQISQNYGRLANQLGVVFEEKSISAGSRPGQIDRESETVCSNAYSKVFNSQRQLEAATNMARAFHESIVFFQRKWQEQVEQLVADYPVTLTNPRETHLDKLLAPPNGLAEAQTKLKAGLRIA
ncbi:MAG: hypothetical protein WC028_29375 [Candidatus Obscuribacterales bacterium]|jgi:hypothetical protein